MNDNTPYNKNEPPHMNMYAMDSIQGQQQQQPQAQAQSLQSHPHPQPQQATFSAMSPQGVNATTTAAPTHTTEHGSSSHGKRTRITRACDTCRRKKIKCDVDTQKPCSTCQQYNWECTFHDTAKKRGPPKGYIESLETRLEKMESLLKNLNPDQSSLPSAAGSEPSNDAHTSKRRRARSTNEGGRASEGKVVRIDSGAPGYYTANNLISSNRESDDGKVIRFHGSSSGYYLMGNLLSANNENDESETPDDVGRMIKEKHKVYYVPSANGNQSIKLRRINIDDDDLMIVRDATADEEALQIADDGQEAIEQIIPRAILTALVHTFFTDAHITVPVLDKDEYLDAFHGRTTPPPAPLLTYSICAYACYLKSSDDPIFKEAGIERNHVFQILLDRAIFLVRKEYLKPRVVTIQALVLLCAHPTYSTSTYRNWILAGMAVRMAQDLGLHRTVTTIEVSSEFKEKRKRLWYSCYNTDRWCCAVMGRPLAIADSDCDVDLPLTHGASGKEDFVMFVNFVKLSGILGEVLRRIYSPKAKSNGYRTKVMEQTVWSLQKMLEEWFYNVPEGYKITEADLNLMKANPNIYTKDSKKLIEGGPLTICYHAVVLLLHRPFIVIDNDDGSSTEMPSLARATDLCRKTAKLSIDVARTIPVIAIAKFGWNFAVYSLFQAALIHLYYCTSDDPKIAKESQEYVRICKDKCLIPLSEDIPAGPPLIPFLQTLSNLIKKDDFNNPNNNAQGEQHSHSQDQQQRQQPQQTQIAQLSSSATQPMPNTQAPNVASAPTGAATAVPANVTPGDAAGSCAFSGTIPSQLPINATAAVTQPYNSNSANTASFIDNLTGDSNQSWLLNGTTAGGPALSQAAWQQLFSTAGTPFTVNSGGPFDAQGWNNFFAESQPSLNTPNGNNPNMFM